MKIVTNYVYPPIPIRQFDWSAIDDDTYDGAEDSSCPIGYGATEQAALDDLLDKLNDHCLSDAEQKAQALRCACRGSDDYCVCQNVPDDATKAERRAASLVSSKECKSESMSLTYAIADLHGRYDLLIQALNTIFRRGSGGTIITLGDYIDRGPNSRDVISHLMSLREAPQAGWKVICLKGNHEDMMVETIGKPLDFGWWVGNGGAQTLASYGGKVPPEHLAWARDLPTLHVDKHRVFVHAGVDPTRPLDEQTEEFKLWYRYVDNADLGHGERHVVHGHTPNPDGPERYENRTNLDTLAWRTGRLVVAVFDDAKPGAAVEYIEIAERAPSLALTSKGRS